ncbi:polysaccharide biosynthesis tyrosine autokinase [Thiovibrio sp. JS02]
MGKLSKAFEKAFNTDTADWAAARPTTAENGGAEERAAGEEPLVRSVAKEASAALFCGDKWNERLRMSTDPYSQYVEQFKRLRATILHPPSGVPVKTILVTSVAPHEGKGFVCANLGVALSQGVESHALLVDCDLRRPSLAQLFGLSNETGLVDHLRNDVDLSLLVRKTGQAKLSLIPSGKPPRNPAELLDSQKMKVLIDEVAGRYPDRVVIFDSPPNIVASETSILAQQVDGVIIVVRSGGAKREHVKRLIDSIGPEKVIGIVFNAYKENKVKAFLSEKTGYHYNYKDYYS